MSYPGLTPSKFFGLIGELIQTATHETEAQAHARQLANAEKNLARQPDSQFWADVKKDLTEGGPAAARPNPFKPRSPTG